MNITIKTPTEYRQAKSELNNAYRAAKKELAARIRPLLFAEFQGFFLEYPEIGSFQFTINSEIYNDESYEAGLEEITFTLSKEFTSPEFRDVEGDYGYQDLYYEMRDQGKVFQSLLKTFGSEQRIREVSKAAEMFGDSLHDLDTEFLQDTFDDDCVVTVSRNGFTVE